MVKKKYSTFAKGESMKHARLAFFCAALTGCGIGTFENRTRTPNLSVSSKSDVGFFGGSSETTIAVTGSIFQNCMQEHAGNPSASRLCECRGWGVMPGSFPGMWTAGLWYPPGFTGYQLYCAPQTFMKTRP